MICPAGFECVKGAVSLERCPIGHFCPLLPAEEVGNSPQICPAGTKCLETGISDISLSKRICDAGKFCKAGLTAESDIIDCPRGRYCEQGTKYPKLCPIGTYNPVEGLSDISGCLACPAGHYCPGFGNNATEESGFSLELKKYDLQMTF